jgi:hypothetical protein
VRCTTRSGGTELVEASGDNWSAWTLTPPATYGHRGGYVLRSGVPPVAEIARPTQEVRVDAYVSGTRLLVVEQGALQSTSESSRAARRIEVPGVGDGHVVSTPHGAVITLYPDAATFVRLSGTMSTDALERLAARLRRRK